MKYGKALKAIMKSKKVTQQKLGERLDITQSAVGMTISRSNPRLEQMVEYANALGYDVALTPKAASLPDNSYLIDMGGED